MNTLITLYQGFGFDCEKVLRLIEQHIHKYEDWGEEQAGQIYDRYKEGEVKGIFVIGNGPNIGTACEAALILTETVKIPFVPMALPQYDHGPKESAENTIIIPILTDGPARERSGKLIDTVTAAGAMVVPIEENNIQETLSPLACILPLNFLAHFLAVKFGVQDSFSVGNKITIVD